MQIQYAEARTLLLRLETITRDLMWQLILFAEVDLHLQHQIQQHVHHQLQDEVQEPYLVHLARIELTHLQGRQATVKEAIRLQDRQVVVVAEAIRLQNRQVVVVLVPQPDLQVVVEAQAEVLEVQVLQAEDAVKIQKYKIDI